MMIDVFLDTRRYHPAYVLMVVHHIANHSTADVKQWCVYKYHIASRGSHCLYSAVRRSHCLSFAY